MLYNHYSSHFLEAIINILESSLKSEDHHIISIAALAVWSLLYNAIRVCVYSLKMINYFTLVVHVPLFLVVEVTDSTD